MPRRYPNQADLRVQKKWVKEGRGKGRKENYKSWLRTQNFSSRGQSQRIPSHITGDRIVHLFSNHESNAHLIYEASPLVVDIREQFPLLPKSDKMDPASETMEIARELGVDHPCDDKGRPYVMTTDLLVTIKVDGVENHFARAVKEVKELGSKEQRAKLEIARRYHERRGHQWAIITERDIPMDLVMNLETLREFRDITRYKGVPAETITRVEAVLLPMIWKGELSLSDAAASCDEQLGIKPATSLTVVYHLLCMRKWTIDLMQPLKPWEPLKLLTPQAKAA